MLTQKTGKNTPKLFIASVLRMFYWPELTKNNHK